MALIGWGKPNLFVQKLETGKAYKWRGITTPVEGTTNFETSKGDKMEAKFEGGAYADVQYKKNTNTLTFDLFVRKGDKKPFADVDGVIKGEYKVALQPEDPTVPSGLLLKKCKISSEVKYTSEEGTKLTYTVEPIAPEDESASFQMGTITVTKTGDDITAITCTEYEAESDVEDSSPAA